MPLSTSDLISRIRAAIDDSPASKSILQENLARSRYGNQVGGGNKNFAVGNTRLISGTLAVVSDGATVTPASIDLFRGRFVLTVAPASSLLATYDFEFFTDTELTVFLENAASFVSTTDLTFVSVDTGLGDAIVYKAASDAAFALSARSSPYYNAGAGGKSSQKGDISKKYRDLAEDLFGRATKERDAFYGPRKGMATSPAYGQIAPAGRIVSPYTPRR